MKSPDTNMDTSEQKSPEFKKGDKVKLTKEEMALLERDGFLEGFPSIEGTVEIAGMVGSENKLSVNFGGAVRLVEKEDIIKIEEQHAAEGEVESLTYSNTIMSALEDAIRYHSLAEIKSKRKLNDVQLEIIKELAFDENGRPKNSKIVEEELEVVEALYKQKRNLLKMSSRELIDLVKK